MKRIREHRRIGAACLVATWLAGCTVQVVNTAEPEVPVQTPDPFLAAEDPALKPTGQPEWFAAASLDPTCYYYEPKKYWYRFYRNRWFQAFRWDGAWFELPESEVPDFLKTEVPAIPELKKSRRQRLEELERQYEELERREQLEREAKEREAQERKAQEGAAPSGEAGEEPRDPD